LDEDEGHLLEVLPLTAVGKSDKVVRRDL